MKYLITDPCYIVSDHEWDKLGALYGWGTRFIESLKGNHSNKDNDGSVDIIVAARTQWGDGSLDVTNHLGKSYTIGVDAGLVCLAKVDDDYGDFFGAYTDDLEDAMRIYNEALTI